MHILIETKKQTRKYMARDCEWWREYGCTLVQQYSVLFCTTAAVLLYYCTAAH